MIEVFNPFTVYSGRVLLAAAKVSAANGVAFVDFGVPNVLTNQIGKLLCIKDNTGKMLQGWIAKAGTGETLATTGGPLNDGELFANPNMTTDEPPGTAWTRFGLWTITGGVAVAVNNNMEYLRQAYFGAFGWLLKWGMDLVSHVSGTGVRIVMDNYVVSGGYVITPGTYSGYKMIVSASASYSGCYGTTNWNGTVDNFTAKQVLAPSATGVTIVSQRDGNIFNWAYQQPGFSYISEFYTYEIVDETAFPVWMMGSNLVPIFMNHYRRLAA
jgi:hypothetical protein